MDTNGRKLAFDAPETFFAHPHQVVESAMLSHDDKIRVLRNWKRQLEKLRDENTDQGSGAVRLKVDSRFAAVSDALCGLHRTY